MAGVDGERELEEFLAGALSGKPDPPQAAEPETTEEQEVVHDERPGVEPLPDDGATAPPPSPEVAPAAETEEQPAEEEAETKGDPHVTWASKKFGDDPAKWARAAYEREQHISRLSAEKGQAEQVARQAIEYAQQMEAQAEATVSSGMPMSASEEAWVEQAMSNPAGYAYSAARSGNIQLYNAVIDQIAEDNPQMAAAVATQVQMTLREEQARAQAERVEPNGGMGDFNTDMGQSFARLGIDVQEYGPAMMEMIETLGEHHRYTQEILGGDARTRDLALSAVYDLVRTGQTTTRRVAETEHDEKIRREGELRREAAGVVTGSPHVAPPKEDPFMAGMEAEWRRRGQWYDEES